MMYPIAYRTRTVNPAAMLDRMFRDLTDVPAAPIFRVDVRQTDDAYLIEAELPGVKMEDVDIAVENDVLTIAADVNTENRTDKEGYLHTERMSGHMERAFTLEGICQEAITANMENGVLTVLLPKEAPTPRATRRKIAVGGASQMALAAPEAQ